MTARILMAALAAFFISVAHADDPTPVGKQLVSAAEAVTTTGPGFSSDGKAQRIVATGISTATVTVYGTNVYCGKTCSASSTSATSVGTITSSGDSVDNQTYLYYFALVTAYTSGTIDVTMTEQPAGGAGSSSTSPAYTTIVDSSGDSAVDAAANAVKVLNYVSENAYTPSAVTVGAAATEIISLDVGAVSASRLTCNIVNDNTANDRTINVISIYLSPTGTYTDATAEYSSTDGGLSDWASPSGHLLMVRTGAPGAIADTTPDTSLDETDVLTLTLDVAGFQTVGMKATASGAGGQVTPKCYYN